MKIYFNTNTLTKNNQKLLQEDLVVRVEMTSNILSVKNGSFQTNNSKDILIEISKTEELAQQNHIYILSELSTDIDQNIRKTLQLSETQEIW